MRSRILIVILLLSAAHGIACAQRMQVKRALGFDFSTPPDDVEHYYGDLGATVVREDVRTSAPDTNGKRRVVRYVAFGHTPPFLSVSTSYINLGLVDGKIEVITIMVPPGKKADLVDYRLYDRSGGRVAVDEREGVKVIRWSFEDCTVEKEKVAVRGDSAAYYKYDILPVSDPY